MIELKNNKTGLTIISLKLNPEDIDFIFEGDVQKITTFKVKDNFDIKIRAKLKEILYNYWWGDGL